MTQKANSLETEVAIIFRALGYKVENELVIAGQNFDMLVRHNVPGLGEHVSILECIDHKRKIMQSKLNEILNKFKQVSDDGDLDIGLKNARLVIVSTSGFSASARKLAKSQGAICHTLDELRAQIIDFPTYVKTFLNEAWANNYINLNATEGGILPAELMRKLNLVDTILSSLTKSEVSSILLNGKAGSGKTHTMRKIASILAENYLLNPTGAFVPIFIELRKITETHSLNDEIANIFESMSNSKFS